MNKGRFCEMRCKRILILGILLIACFSVSCSFAQSSVSATLQQILDDYENNPRRRDTNWKGKQIEITAEVMNIQNDGAVIIRQGIEGDRATHYDGSFSSRITYSLAISSFRSSENRALLNIDRGSQIRVRGTIDGITEARVSDGSVVNIVRLINCVIVR